MSLPSPSPFSSCWVGAENARAAGFSNGAIGCKTCDGFSRGPIPWGSYKHDPYWDRKFNLCPVGAADTGRRQADGHNLRQEAAHSEHERQLWGEGRLVLLLSVARSRQRPSPRLWHGFRSPTTHP